MTSKDGFKYDENQKRGGGLENDADIIRRRKILPSRWLTDDVPMQNLKPPPRSDYQAASKQYASQNGEDGNKSLCVDVDGIMRSPSSPATPPWRPIPAEETKTENDLVASSNDRSAKGRDLIFPGALRVGGPETASLNDHDTIVIGGDDGDQGTSVACSAAAVLAWARLIAEPVVAISADTTMGELELRLRLAQNNKRRQTMIGVGVVFVLSVVFIGLLSLSLFGRENGNATTSIAPTPTATPTATPTSEQEALWISLIQSKMPLTRFDEGETPQRRALDWMLEDSYTMRLNDDSLIVLQRFALAVLFYSTNGPTGWTSVDSLEWLSPKMECDWGDDVFCVGGSVVTWLQLGFGGLSGSIPPEIGLLTDLTTLSLYENNLVGTIPTEIGLVSGLTRLFLHNNADLSGSVPTELARLTRLISVFLASTKLSGTIPSSLCTTLATAVINCGEIVCDCCTAGLDASPC